MISISGANALDIVIVSISMVLLILCLTAQRRTIFKGLRLPPGPKGKFMFANAGEHEWEVFARLGTEYGDLVYFEAFGQHTIVINSADVAYELFERRSSIYSDRCDFPMMNDLMGFDWHTAFMRYGDRWRRHRRLLHQKFHPGAADDYKQIQTRHTMELLRRFRDTPEAFVKHLRHTAGAIIMEVVYGILVQPENDHYVEIAKKAMWGMTMAGNPGAYLVDTFPLLKHIPEWVPGARFRKEARIWRQCTTDMSILPFMAVKKALSAGTVGTSVTASLLEEALNKVNGMPPSEEDIREIGSSAYAAGSDTTVSALHTFMLAMVVSPEAQKKAQAELDSVIGPYRLPEFGDRDSLPYINALCKEVLRWHPVVPLGVAHCVTQDDVYRDYFIPKGTIIVGNAWKMCHVETMYGSETEKFKPERFLVPGVKDPNSVWGFGRRICSGRYLADNSMFIAVASILKVFDITLARDNKGNEIPVKVAFTPGFMSFVFQINLPELRVAENLAKF